MSRELEATLAGRIVNDLANKQAPWHRTWNATELGQKEQVNSNIGMPTNCVSGKLYTGINFLNLNMTARLRKYDSRWWGTRRQWERLGGRVKSPPDYIRASEWPETVYLFRPKANGRVSFFRKWEVYNVEQIDGPFQQWMASAGRVQDVSYRLAEEIIKATGADIHLGGDKAIYYRPPKDYIDCPAPQQFVAVRYYFATLMHELVHWSECRLGWTGSYALGELVAEIGSIILCERCGIPANDSWDNHMSYLQYWLQELKEDTTAVFRATSQAFKSAAFVLSFYEKAHKAAA